MLNTGSVTILCWVVLGYERTENLAATDLASRTECHASITIGHGSLLVT
jgi:hypothetical protein